MRAYSLRMTDENKKSYQVLARKYRPRTFEDMIGQEALVTTLTNAFKVGRVAHAFMLTGVRGIGKTTTARLLARALNYERDGVEGPSVDLANPGVHCESIMASTHMDVLEMDAASRTGVENMREMLDGVRYAPVSARYKVYIIDEVHMLSTGAFNALLKTLEEPPDHAKFIFATTEIRKVPITVLSRCQRFDLRRVDADVLSLHLRGIADKEGAKISDDGLSLIARAAEGSVRDSLSLLDQAIVQAAVDDKEVDAADVRTMLGLADRVRVLDLFSHAATGDGKAALIEMRSQYDDGADPAIVMRDLLDICHDVTRAKTLGEHAAFDAASDVVAKMRSLSDALSTGQLTRMWQLLLKAHSDVRAAPVPLAAAEMALLSLSVAGQMPPPEMAAELIAALRDGTISAPSAGGGGGGGGNTARTNHSSTGSTTSQSAPAVMQASSPTSAPMAVVAGGAAPRAMTVTDAAADIHEDPAPTPQVQPQNRLRPVTYFEDFAAFVDALSNKDIALASDLKRHVRPVSFTPNSFTYQTTKGAPASLTVKMKEALHDLTGANWDVTPVPSGGGETIKERQKREDDEQSAKDRAHPAFSHPLLSGATLIEIRDIAPTSSLHDSSDKD